MLTYSDMVTLLLCFFVLLFAFSRFDIQGHHERFSRVDWGARQWSGGASR